MAITRQLIINLTTSAVGIFLCLVALVTPGWGSIPELFSISIFYVCFTKSGECSATEIYDGDVPLYLILIDVQLGGVLAIVLGVVGWLALLVYAISNESSASSPVTSGIILLVASTFESVLLVKFVVFNIMVFKELYKSVQFILPYSIIISIFGLFLIMFTVVRIFIGNRQRENNHLRTDNSLVITTETYSQLELHRI
ncbi:uncharacterized protein LOC134272237 [Saccostrea cucullata]|uniref:uncharacterized protein LOC134272237 n=1 Tax=Saccostrea cuccullata TaxID=36930 RepID=UPI002ED4644D